MTHSAPSIAAPAKTWVVDANVLYNAASFGAACGPREYSKRSAALYFFVVAHGKHALAEDGDGRMAGEYFRAWKTIKNRSKEYPSMIAVQDLWWRFWNRTRHRGHVPLPADVRKQLEASNAKPEGDIAYVEAAAASPDKLLVSEDSDITKDENKALIAERLGVIVLVAEEAKSHL